MLRFMEEQGTSREEYNRNLTEGEYHAALGRDLAQKEQEDSGFMAQLKADKILQDFEDTLDNVKRTDHEVIIVGNPIVGPNLKTALMALAKAYVNPNKLLSNYDEAEINWRSKEAADAIGILLEVFHLEIRPELLNIVQLAGEDMIDAAFRRAKYGLERETGRKQSHEIVSVGTKQRPSGTMDSVKRFLQ